MIVPFLQLDYNFAVIALLPPQLFRCFKKQFHTLVLRAICFPMPLRFTQNARFRLTPTTLAIPQAAFHMYIFRLDPFATSASWTIHTVFSRKLSEFPIPQLLERNIKKFFGMLERNMVARAAFGRHKLLVND